MNRYGYADPFRTLVGGHVPTVVGQMPYPMPYPMMVGQMPPGNGTMVPGTPPMFNPPPGFAPPGFPPGGQVPGFPFPYNPWACGGPAPALAPQAVVASVQPCAAPIGITSNVNGALPIDPGDTRVISVSPQTWGCVTDIDVPRTMGFAFTIDSFQAGNCELLPAGSGPIQTDTLAPDSIHPCIQTFQICPWNDIEMTVTNISDAETPAVHFYATLWSRLVPQSCLPCDSFA